MITDRDAPRRTELIDEARKVVSEWQRPTGTDEDAPRILSLSGRAPGAR